MSQSKKQSSYRPRPVSGFPEWLPELKIVEQQWMDTVRACFESYGFTPLETPAVEELDVLLAKGETDKEIYVLQRLQADEDDSSDARLGLHYDLTVPFARYVAQHFNDLNFPFKRYQIQKAWRGERPQAGRFREFYQCDIDVISQDQLPLSFDGEMLAVVQDALGRLGIDGVCLHVSNRKILSGFLQGMGIEDAIPVIRILDKLDKIGPEGVAEQLAEGLGLSPDNIDKLLSLGKIQTPGPEFAEQVRAFGISTPLLEDGIDELCQVLSAVDCQAGGGVLADLSIARGFDYYTGTVYEGRMVEYPGFGSVVSGGRYDDLAGAFINRRLPGVGISLGLSRLFSKMVAEGRIEAGRRCPTDVLVVVPSTECAALADETAAALRRRGLNVERYHGSPKLKRQLAYAEKKGIGFVWFPPFEDGQAHEVKDMATSEQYNADPESWTKPER